MSSLFRGSARDSVPLPLSSIHTLKQGSSSGVSLPHQLRAVIPYALSCHPLTKMIALVLHDGLHLFKSLFRLF